MAEVLSARRTQTRERLLDAATAAFAAKGVLGASVEEICEAAGFTRGAFYSNFDTKDELCLALLRRQADDYLGATREAMASLPTGDALGGRSVDAVIADAIAIFLAAQPADRVGVLAGAELRLHAAREESMRAPYLELSRASSSAFARLIEQGAASIGLRLTVAGEQAVAILNGVYEQGAINALIAGPGQAEPARAELLAGVLKSLLAPA